jgi:hypothetical protein
VQHLQNSTPITTTSYTRNPALQKEENDETNGRVSSNNNYAKL